MPVQPQYLEYVLEQMAGLGGVSPRRMFGGVGLYSGELFFGLIDDDTLYFKTDASNSAEYESRRMPRFMPPTNRPLGPMGYHQVPADVIEVPELLVAWARKSVQVALASHAAKAKPTKKPKKKKRVSPARNQPARRPRKARKARKPR